MSALSADIGRVSPAAVVAFGLSVFSEMESALCPSLKNREIMCGRDASQQFSRDAARRTNFNEELGLLTV